jgi:hypothetical protein
MKRAKLTVRVPRDPLENAKLYAAQNYTTLADLIEACLSRIPARSSLDNAPNVRRLSGALSSNVSVGDYRKHLEEKYDNQASEIDRSLRPYGLFFPT